MVIKPRFSKFYQSSNGNRGAKNPSFLITIDLRQVRAKKTEYRFKMMLLMPENLLFMTRQGFYVIGCNGCTRLAKHNAEGIIGLVN